MAEPEPAITDEERAILAFEERWAAVRHGAKEAAIRDTFHCSSARYYQKLNQLMDTKRALSENPVIVHRLLRLRAERTKARAARQLGPVSLR